MTCLRHLGLGLRVWGLGLGVRVSGSWVSGLGFEAWGLEFGFQGSGFRVQGLWFGVDGWGKTRELQVLLLVVERQLPNPCVDARAEPIALGAIPLALRPGEEPIVARATLCRNPVNVEPGVGGNEGEGGGGEREGERERHEAHPPHKQRVEEGVGGRQGGVKSPVATR